MAHHPTIQLSKEVPFRGKQPAGAAAAATAAAPHKGLNLPKRFTNLHILDSSGPQIEKRFLYRKKIGCLVSKLNFVIDTCHLHFTLGLTILVEASLCSDFTEMLE